MTKIIGHRGAAGLALENSRASFLAALAHGVDAIELDTHLTADDKLVVIHDPHTERVSTTNVHVQQETLKQLQTLRLRNDEAFLSLDEALDVIGNHVPVYIELKAYNSIDELLLVLGRHPKTKVAIVSYLAEELRQVKRILPDTPVYLSEHFSPIAVIQAARSLHADGIQLNKWLMNPLTYRLAKRYKLEINVYTVNSPLMARFMNFFYPDIHMYTDHPERFVKRGKRSTSSRSAKRSA